VVVRAGVVTEARGGRKAIRSFRASPALRPSRDYPSEQARRGPHSERKRLRRGFYGTAKAVPLTKQGLSAARERGPFRGLAVDAGVRGCAEVRSHISEARCGAPSFGEGIRCGPPALPTLDLCLGLYTHLRLESPAQQ
jgi:hypothetical protein